MAKKTKKSAVRKFSNIFEFRYSKVGLVVGALFFAFSLYPSMLPRTFILQSVVSAISLVIGYGLGAFAYWLWGYMQLPRIKGRARKITIGIVLALVAFACLSATIQSVNWQNSVRAEFDVAKIGVSFILATYVLTALFALVLLLIGRSIRKLYQVLAFQFAKFVPHRIAIVAGVLTVAILINFIYTGVLARTFFAVANQFFSTLDVKINPKFSQPSTPLRSGSEESKVTWESLGVQGRKFVATGPTTAEISAFSGTEAKEPIRVFAGIASADSIDERADLVLQELIRTKAFERESLLITTSTGTGWIDPKSTEPFEYINNGDSAIAGMQYSFLPSWISLLADQETVKSSSETLFNKIYTYWAQLPEDTRPKIYLYGLSLGSFGVEEVLNSVELVNEPVNGALLAGPPFVNELHSTLENNRDKESPAWQPVINNGTTVRFTSKDNALDKPTGTWGATKIVYLQHATDPIVWFSQDLLFTEPDWLKRGQRGPGLTEDFVYVPIVTLWQMAADLPAAGSVKDGFGHNYATTSNIDAWSVLVGPADWTKEKTQKLKDLLSKKVYEGA